VDNDEQVTLSRRILEKSQRETEPYLVQLLGQEFIVFPGVFSPKYLGSTRVFTENVSYRPGESFLEVGCGTGITAITAALRGAGRVVAVDLSPEAVENTRANAERHGVAHVVDARVSDIFSALRPVERFDTIYWNMPFIYVEPGFVYRSELERAIFDPGYEATKSFLRDAPGRLNEGGRVLIGFADFGDERAFLGLCGEVGYTLREVTRGPDFERQPITFILYELTLPREA